MIKKLIEQRQTEIAELRESIAKSTDIDEVKRLGEEMRAKQEDVEALEATLRSAEFDPLQTVGQMEPMDKRDDAPKLRSMEYREAFMNYVQNGTKNEILEMRSTGTSSDLGGLGVGIPLTVMDEIIVLLTNTGVYGQVYNLVKKTNLKGGVRYPIGEFLPTFERLSSENTGGTDTGSQNKITGSITFSYLLGQVKIGRSILEVTVGIEAFERAFAESVAEAYLKAMDIEVVKGNGTTQCEGIVTVGVRATVSDRKGINTVEFDENDMADWQSWQTKLFAQIPLAMRRERPVFLMTPQTFEENIKTLADDNNRPVYMETFNPVTGDEICRFNGREVVLVEEAVLPSFSDIDLTSETITEAGKVFGIYMVPNKSYAINTNMEFTVTDYFDQDTNSWIKKALVINDGKVLNGSYIYLLKKKATSNDSE